ncbi:MAG: PhzF family phenazine biosynthesis protein [Candidatus Acidiferrales bacterium]
MSGLEYTHVDVFSPTPYSGNSLPVFLDAGVLSSEQMRRITQEMRHFESVFLESTPEPHTVRARVFDLFEELPFAGHPIIGAAAVLHHKFGHQSSQTWKIGLPSKSVTVTTERTNRGFFGLLDQGVPEFLDTVKDRKAVACAFNLEPHDLHPDLPLEVVSTGLRYLVIPVQPGALERARILQNITNLLRGLGAQFAVLLDESRFEMRHWNNDGIIEDIATGSAAGTVGAYCFRHGLARGGEAFVLNQGRFTGRSSQLRVQPEGTPASVGIVKVGGDVSLVGRGTLEALPEPA